MGLRRNAKQCFRPGTPPGARGFRDLIALVARYLRKLCLWVLRPGKVDEHRMIWTIGFIVWTDTSAGSGDAHTVEAHEFIRGAGRVTVGAMAGTQPTQRVSEEGRKGL